MWHHTLQSDMCQISDFSLTGLKQDNSQSVIPRAPSYPQSMPLVGAKKTNLYLWRNYRNNHASASKVHALTFKIHTWGNGGPGSSVCLATGYGLDGPVIDSRWGEIFRTRPARTWGPPNLLYNGYRVFPGVKRPGRVADHPPPSSTEVENE
jgi:hypothetical protein